VTRGLPQEKGLPQASEGPPQAKNPTGDMAFFLLPRFLPLFFHQPHHSLSFIQLFFVRFPWCCKGKCVSLLSRFVAGQRASGPRTNSYALVFLVFVVVFVLAAPRAPPPPPKELVWSELIFDAPRRGSGCAASFHRRGQLPHTSKRELFHRLASNCRASRLCERRSLNCPFVCPWRMKPG